MSSEDPIDGADGGRSPSRADADADAGPGPDSGADAAPLDCDEAVRRIAAFVRRSPSPDEARALRGHIVRCESCAGLYRQTLYGAARVGRTMREDRVEGARVRRHDELVRLSRGTGYKRTSRSWLKLFLVTCGLIFLFTRLTALGFGASLAATQARGSVVAAGVQLAGDQEVKLERGARCETGPGASVVLLARDTSIALGAETRVIVESPAGDDGPRLRLLAGVLDVRGPCVVTTEFGVATLASGRARLALGETLEASCGEGELALLGPLGASTVAAGDELTLSFDG